MAWQNDRRLTQVKAIGQGYRLKNSDSYLKFGVRYTDPIKASEVLDFTYSQDNFLDTGSGNQALKAYFKEVHVKKVDTNMTEGANYDSVVKQWYSYAHNESETTFGGPSYLEVGLEQHLEHVVKKEDGSQSVQTWTIQNFEKSAVEFYTFKNPTVLRMHPTSGLTKGGTFVEVIGTWFRNMPEYGIVPHCKFGDKIVRAYFDSSVRIVCQSPPNKDTTTKLPFQVSLNGVDWTGTGFTYSFYEEPVMTSIYPDMGSIAGGDIIYINGDKFTNNTDPAEFLCRFTPVSSRMPPKTIRATFIN